MRRPWAVRPGAGIAGMAVLVCVSAVAPPARAVPILQATRAASHHNSLNSVLFEKAASPARAAMASTTKVMTFAIALDALAAGQVELADTVAITNYAAQVPGSSFMGSQALDGDEAMTLEDALFAVALSANDVTTAVAEFLANAVENGVKATGSNSFESWTLTHKFDELMNDKAAALGLTDTHFENPTGLDELNHYTTPLDLNRLWNSIHDHPETHRILGVRSRVVVVTDFDGAAPWSGIAGCSTAQAPVIRCTLTKGYGYYPGVYADKNGGTPNCISCLVSGATRLGESVSAAVQQSPNPVQVAADVAELFRDGFEQVLKPNLGAQKAVAKAQMSSLARVPVGGVNVTEVTVTATLLDEKLTLATWLVDANVGTIQALSSTTVEASGALGVEVAAVRSGVFATVVRMAASNDLRTWKVASDDSGKLTPGSSQPLPFGTSPAITTLGFLLGWNDVLAHFIVGTRTVNGNLRISLFTVANDATIALKATWVAPYVIADEVALASDRGDTLGSASRPMLLAAVRTTAGSQRVTALEVDTTAATITWRNDLDTVAGSSISLTHTGKGSFATAMVQSKAGAMVTFWRVDPRSRKVVWRNNTAGGRAEAAATAAVAPAGPSGTGVLTVLGQADGTIRLVLWEDDERGEYTGKEFLRLAGNDTGAGKGTSPDVVGGPTAYSAGNYVTAKIDPWGVLQLATWRIGPIVAGVIEP